jgi:hypothetical protein
VEKSRRKHREPAITEIFFIVGALLVLIGLLYSLKKSWPSFDPLALAMLIGIGLLLVVVCERLRILINEVSLIAEYLERWSLASERSGEPPEDRDEGLSAHGRSGRREVRSDGA